MLSRLSCALLLLIPATTRAAEFELKDGDRVVVLGSTLVEREQRYGYWETALTLRFPDRNIIFRNLGWSGDTVWGEARAGFDNAAKGYERLVQKTLALKPTVIMICYGTNESFSGEVRLDAFKKQYAKLLDDLAPAKARIILMTPLAFEKAPQLTDPAQHNANLSLYCAAIQALAAERKLQLVDLFQKARVEVAPVTDNGMHPTAEGFRLLAPLFEYAFGFDKPMPVSSPAAEALRKVIVDKNELYFHRWRPQNETYLYLFRKHEQGKNAKEVEEFDPLVAAKEKEIARLRAAKSE